MSFSGCHKVLLQLIMNENMENGLFAFFTLLPPSFFVYRDKYVRDSCQKKKTFIYKIILKMITMIMMMK